MTVDRDFVRHKGVVKGITVVCQLVGSCDGHGGDVKRLGKV